jgi:hypothetical protein
VWPNFKSMPLVLKFLTIHALGSAILLIVSVIPHDSFSIDGTHVSYAEWWSSGAGIGASVTGLILPITGYLLLTKHPYARPSYVAALIIAFLSPIFMANSSKYGLEYFAPSLVLVLAISAYLYLPKSVKVYFASNQRFEADAQK